MFSVSFGLFFFFAGSVNVLLAWNSAPVRLVRTYALFATAFWTIAFVPFAFVDPVAQPLVGVEGAGRPLARASRSVVEWSLGSPTSTVRPP